MSDRFFCSEASLERGEPLYGTASTVQRWLLVERNGPWGAQALHENDLEARTSEHLRTLSRQLRARVLLIRRHGRYEQTGFRVLAAFTGRGSRWMESFHFANEADIVEHDFSALRRGASVGGEPVRELQFFVCTHGKHDPCCAQKGRLVAHALSTTMEDSTWETSHIGGDRFAGNVLILPLGIYYGRVEARQAVRAMRGLAEGRLDLGHYRGRTCYPFPVQAAEWLARQKLSLLQLADLSLVDHEDDGALSRTTFRLRDGRTIRVEVERSSAEPAPLTCHADSEARAPAYWLRQVEEL